MEKVEFLKEFGDDYGYPNGPKSIQDIIDTEFKRLGELVYLDHAGATLYSELQLEAVLKDFTSNIYGNPHSQSDASCATAEIIQLARQKVLDYCQASAKDYKCVFTSGATAALKLVGECFPWTMESHFMYTVENHNSVLGIREYALNRGAAAIAVDIEEHDGKNAGFIFDSPSCRIRKHSIQRRASPRGISYNVASGVVHNLFAFPSECNFSGSRFDLNLVNIIKENNDICSEGLPCAKGRWLVLIDAAKGCGTQPPNLAKFQADFVVVSFYKVFGYPTGLGALIVRTEAADLLKKTYFSGGTVASSIADIDFFRRRAGVEDWFEDGTQSFLSIASIHHGFKIINELTISAIERHTASLATYVRRVLSDLKHGNGSAVCILYGRSSVKVSPNSTGPTITFNLKRYDGSWVGHKEVEKLASLSGIQLRTGCFCNPGACSRYLGLLHVDLLSNLEAGHICWDDNDILDGRPTGAIRISFGYMSNFDDAKKFIDFISTTFLSGDPLNDGFLFSNKGIDNGPLLVGNGYLKSIFVYPIKSCGGFNVDNWPLCDGGLLHDREWMLRTSTGEILTQKKAPEMSVIRTSIDLIRKTLFVESPLCAGSLRIPLDKPSPCMKEDVEIYGQRYEVLSYDDEVNQWFSRATARSCALYRCLSSRSRMCSSSNGRSMCRDNHSKLTFVNEAQILLISEESVSDLCSKICLSTENKEKRNMFDEVSAVRFRPNFIMSGQNPYVEDSWKSITIGDVLFTSLGGCNRCQMINIDFQSGELRKSREPLSTLASYRRFQGKILFGILLKYERDIAHSKIDRQREDDYPRIKVGQRVVPS